MKDRSTEMRRALFTTEARRTSALCSLHFLGSALVVVGFFGPWVAHKTAALTVTGYELSEFAKFFPEVQSGAVGVRRSLFIAPLLAATISLGLVIHRSDKGLLLRLAFTAFAAALPLVTLPPLQAISEPQYRLQLTLVGAAVLLTLVTPLTHQLSGSVRGLFLFALGLSGALPALWQAELLRPLVGALYGTSIWPGWGIVACTMGFVMLLISGLRNLASA